MNDQLQESSRDVELQLREELDLANARVTEAQRRLDAVKESIADYEMTINKFREHVTRQQVGILRDFDLGHSDFCLSYFRSTLPCIPPHLLNQLPASAGVK